MTDEEYNEGMQMALFIAVTKAFDHYIIKYGCDAEDFFKMDTALCIFQDLGMYEKHKVWEETQNKDRP